MWYKNGFFKYSTGIILVLLIVFLLGQVGFVLTPLKNALMVVALPLIIALLFYYLLRPLVRLLKKLGLPKFLSIAASFLLMTGLIVLLGILAGNVIVNEFNQLIKELPKITKVAENAITNLINSGNLDFLSTDEIVNRVSAFVEKVLPTLGVGVFSGISAVVGAVTALLFVPLILFYFLIDDSMFAERIIKMFPQKYRSETRDVLVDVDKTLSSYITGQAMVCLVIGILMYIGYLIIGLRYALVLALFSMVTAVIPFLGPLLGIIPAILVGLSYNFFMIIKILIVMLIVQQLEGNLITPQIMSKKISTHPVAIMMVLLVSASLFGFVGILLAIPAYALLKVVIKNAIEIYKIVKEEKADA
jgi:predicted PurR-regulated permease PerM